MELFYYGEVANFGDSINPWFWPHFIDRPFNNKSDRLFVGIGTLLNNRLPQQYSEIHIMGSGAGYGEFVPRKKDNWHVHCVRGPLTAKSLGVEEDLAVADPAILLSQLIDPERRGDRACGFMPHVEIDSPRFRAIIEGMGVVYISPADEPMSVIDQVCRCDRLISSAMHGVILAESFRIPWYPVSTSGQILEFKWQDWFASMKLDASLHRLPSIWPSVNDGMKGRIVNRVKIALLEREINTIQRRGKFLLSSEDNFSAKQEKLREIFIRFNQVQ